MTFVMNLSGQELEDRELDLLGGHAVGGISEAAALSLLKNTKNKALTTCVQRDAGVWDYWPLWN